MTRRPARSTGYARKVAAAFMSPGDAIPEKPERKKPVDHEGPIHRQILKELHAILPRAAFVFHVPNGGARNAIVGAKLKALGTVAGIPDLCIVYLGRAFFLEIKAPRGTLDKPQVAVFELLQQAGAHVALVRSSDEARDVARRWGITREVRT